MARTCARMCARAHASLLRVCFFAQVEPCCGQPFDAKSAGKCALSFFCCGLCAFSKLYAHSTNGDECGIVNHCLPACLCPPCVHILARHSLRVKAGVPPATPAGWAGDVLCALFCAPCALCQELRSAPKDSWDFVAAIQAKKVKPMVKPFMLLQK